MHPTLLKRMRLALGALAALLPVGLVGQRPVDTLSTVQVTVLRTPFDLARAPFSVTVVTAKDATAARPGFAMDEVLGRLAGVQVDNRLNVAVGERIAIRGLGARSQFGVRGVRIIVDDIPATLADGQTVLNNVDLGSLGHAQLLRGPASALYGNASGGVVLLESAPPPPVSFSPNLRVLAGSDGLRRYQVGAGGMHGNTGYTVNASRVDYSGFRAFSNARNFHANGVATHEVGSVFVKVVANTELHSAQNPGSLSDSLLRIDRRQAFANNVAQRTGEDGSQTQGGVSARIVLPAGELRFASYALHRALTIPFRRALLRSNATLAARARLMPSRRSTRAARSPRCSASNLTCSVTIAEIG
jgi:iron complex outermembrane recepter protein